MARPIAIGRQRIVDEVSMSLDEMNESWTLPVEAKLITETTSKPFELHLVKSGKSYFVHRSLLARESSFFEHFFNSAGRFQEHENDKMDFELDPFLETVFPVLIQWMYRDSYTLPEKDDDTAKVHFGMYLLADRFCIDILQFNSLCELQVFLRRGNLRAKTIIFMVLRAYEYTGDSYSDEKNSPSEVSTSKHALDDREDGKEKHEDGSTDPRRDLQLMLASAAAAQLSSLRRREEFKHCMRLPVFIADLVPNVNNGSFQSNKSYDV